MKISRASTYALYGLCHLVRVRNGRRVPLSEIRLNHGVPEKHLAKIFLQLVRARILTSSPGVNGGFSLARKPGEVSLLEIIEIVDGPVLGDGCLLAQMPCLDIAECRLNSLWTRAQGAMLKVLAGATLADVAGGDSPRRKILKGGGKKRG